MFKANLVATPRGPPSNLWTADQVQNQPLAFKAVSNTYDQVGKKEPCLTVPGCTDRAEGSGRVVEVHEFGPPLNDLRGCDSGEQPPASPTLYVCPRRGLNISVAGTGKVAELSRGASEVIEGVPGPEFLSMVVIAGLCAQRPLTTFVSTLSGLSGSAFLHLVWLFAEQVFDWCINAMFCT